MARLFNVSSFISRFLAEVALLNPEVKGETKTTLELLKNDLKQSVQDLQRIVKGEVEEESKELSLLQELERICTDFKDS